MNSSENFRLLPNVFVFKNIQYKRKKSLFLKIYSIKEKSQISQPIVIY